MREIEDQEESRVEQAAYEAWVAEARAHGLNGEADIFRAGWVAACGWKRDESEKGGREAQDREAETADWYEKAEVWTNGQHR
jgi:hypothetical protein